MHAYSEYEVVLPSSVRLVAYRVRCLYLLGGLTTPCNVQNELLLMTILRTPETGVNI
jgi:hypothetical protein